MAAAFHILMIHEYCEMGVTQLRNGKLCCVGVMLLAVVAAVVCPSAEHRVRPAAGTAQVQLQEGILPLVAITFDDGPLRRTTTRLLEGLAQREVPATFFLLGERIAGNEELVLEMARQGHQIGMHTYDHVVLTELTNRQRDIQVEKTAVALDDILGPGEYWVRPPYGLVDKSVTRWAADFVVGGPRGLEATGGCRDD